MFGGSGRRNKNQEESLSKALQPESSPVARGNVTGFDPEALERAAKAARELDNSRNAKSAIELIKSQETTKQLEASAKRAEMDAYAQQMRGQNIEKEADEARKTLAAQTQHDQRRAEYQDQLERKRQVDMLNAQKYMQEEQLKKQEEMANRQEEMRRKTAQYETELRTKTELAKAKVEAEGRITQERKNHDLILEKVRLEASEYRKTLLKAIEDGGMILGDGFSNFFGDRDKLRNTALTLTGIAFGIYGARTSTKVIGSFVESRLGKPSLIRETSRLSLVQVIRRPMESLKRVFGTTRDTEGSALDGIVLREGLTRQLNKIAVSTANTKQNQAPYRHILLYGPPGTGKTMFARQLASSSGLDYAIMTGGDIAPLGRDAVTELHKLFDWAKTSRRGLLLFVDEADAFLKSRGSTSISEDQRNALNAFLFRTGTESDNFMMVYASNQPSQFDEAVMDRVDEIIEFDLPGADERTKMITLYMDKYLINPPGRLTKKVKTQDIGRTEIELAAKETDGFSGRSLSKLVIAWQAAAYGTHDALLTKDSFFETVAQHRSGMETRRKWLSEASRQARVLTSDQ